MGGNKAGARRKLSSAGGGSLAHIVVVPKDPTEQPGQEEGRDVSAVRGATQEDSIEAPPVKEVRARRRHALLRLIWAIGTDPPGLGRVMRGGREGGARGEGTPVVACRPAAIPQTGQKPPVSRQRPRRSTAIVRRGWCCAPCSSSSRTVACDR